MPPTLQEFGEIKATAQFTASAVTEIKELLKLQNTATEKRQDANAEFQQHVTAQLAVLNEQTKVAANYREECDKDREGIEKRVSGLEHWRSRQRGMVAACAGMAGLSGTLIGAAVEWIK